MQHPIALAAHELASRAYELASEAYDERKLQRRARARRERERAAAAAPIRALNGIGPGAGKGARQEATERAVVSAKRAATIRSGLYDRSPAVLERARNAARESRMFASAAREIARLRKAGK